MSVPYPEKGVSNWDIPLKAYIDGVASGGGTVEWDNVTGKPGTYPPSTHTHPDAVLSDSIDNIVSLTQGQYDALGTKSPSTLYVIIPG